MEEKWKMVPGYENLYEVSNCGRVRTAEGKTTKSARFKKRVWKQRVMKLCITQNKYKRWDARVTLWKDGKATKYLVSRLVAITWCDGYKPELTVNHIDGDSLNNKCSNLEWVTRSENIRYGFENGQYEKNRKPLILVINGVSHMFISQTEASLYLGRNKGYINNCIRKHKVPEGVDEIANFA